MIATSYEMNGLQAAENWPDWLEYSYESHGYIMCEKENKCTMNRSIQTVFHLWFALVTMMLSQC